MKYDAVIFDLYGTLVENITAYGYRYLVEIAQALGADSQAFIAYWLDDDFRAQRRCGALPTSRAFLEHVCTRLGIPAGPDSIDAAVQVYIRYGLPSLTPRPAVIDTLRLIKAHGIALGLISDCSKAVEEVWEESAFAGIFDTVILSCTIGIRKPDPRLYQTACERLAVSPTRCLYVGDGDGRELTGAKNAGMDAILLCAPHEREIVMQREDPRQWQGPVIDSIQQVVDYLGISALPTLPVTSGGAA